MPETRESSGAISINNVCKTFNPGTESEIAALRNMTLKVDSGEFVSFVGPSGCGKSTLLRLVAGLDTATDGNIQLDGQTIVGTHYERGMVFQDPTLYPWLTVYDNVATGLRARNVYKKNKEIVQRYINLVGIGGFEKSYPHHLSGGMAQRASLARSLANHPKVLLLDEPFGALDAFTRMQMQDELLRIWQDKGTTMMLVTHDVDEAIYLSDRVVVMSPRPSKVEKIIDIDIERPRARNYPQFLHMRAAILEILNFAKKVDDLSYYL
jgi:NitT/TauT family transport system ATP-binding protein/sulfonate transport system ATP-binding protein